MKNIILLLTFGLVFGGLSSCEKDDSVWGDTHNAHRVTAAVTLLGSTEICHDEYTYQGDLLVSVVHKHQTVQGEGEWLPVYKREMTYQGNEVFVSESDMENGAWNEWDRCRYVVQHGLVMEESYFNLEDGYWVESERYKYEYSGANMTSWKGFELNDEGVMEYHIKGNFLYRSGQIIKANEYEMDADGEMKLLDVLDVSYTSGKPSRYVLSYIDVAQLVNFFKSEYAYELGKVSSREQYFWNEDESSWGNVSSRIDFSYNEFGDLSSQNYTWPFENGESHQELMEYQYEEGNGNAAFFEQYVGSAENTIPTLKSAFSDKSVSGASHSRGHIPYFKKLMQ